jgi:hypothetical protein
MERGFEGVYVLTEYLSGPRVNVTNRSYAPKKEEGEKLASTG